MRISFDEGARPALAETIFNALVGRRELRRPEDGASGSVATSGRAAVLSRDLSVGYFHRRGGACFVLLDDVHTSRAAG
jgi:hypothetical protein